MGFPQFFFLSAYILIRHWERETERERERERERDLFNQSPPYLLGSQKKNTLFFYKCIYYFLN